MTAPVMLASSACTVTTTVVDEPHIPRGVHEKSARIAEYMRNGAIIQVHLKGHADATGSSDYNLALSQRRATAAREHLLEI